MKKEIPNFIQNFLNKHKNFKSDHSKMASFDIIIRLQSVFSSEKHRFFAQTANFNVSDVFVFTNVINFLEISIHKQKL